MKTSVLGAGSWGTALALMLSEKHKVTLYSKEPEKADRIIKDRENREFLPDVHIPDSISITSDLERTADAEMVVVAVPSGAVRAALMGIRPYVGRGALFVSVSKGLEEKTHKRCSEVMEETLPDDCEIAVLAGPSHAEEVSRKILTAVVAASKSEKTAEKLQDAFITPYFRVYTSTDLIGVELGGAVKNVIALAAGMTDGLGYGDNTKAALMTRGISEITRLGTAMGGNAETFAGLTGIGDLIVTCTSMHSRNRRAGILIGEGRSVEETLDRVHMVVEGINSSKAVLALSKKHAVEMPITEEINRVLFEGKNPREAAVALMMRDKKGE